MRGMKQPCLDCGTPTHGTRCTQHATTNTQQKNRAQTITRGPRTQYHQGWKQTSALIRATATTCHICGKGPRANDPWQADHIIPVQHGGTTGPIAAAHRSCNIAKGNRTRHQNPAPLRATPPPPTPTPHPPPRLPPARLAGEWGFSLVAGSAVLA